MAILQEDVLGLEVAMDEPMAMGVIERRRRSRRRASAPSSIGSWVSRFSRSRSDSPATYGMAYQQSWPVAVSPHQPESNTWQNVGVTELAGDADLAGEPFGAEHGGEFGAQDLDGDLAIVLAVVREVDGGHAALAKFALDPVAVSERGFETAWRSHLFAEATADFICATQSGTTRR